MVKAAREALSRAARKLGRVLARLRTGSAAPVLQPRLF